MDIALIAMDLDGTLYNSKKEIDPRTAEALMRAQRAGILLALVSARPLPGLYHARDALRLPEYGGALIACNGGRIVDAKTGALLHHRGMALSEARAVLRALEPLPCTPILDDGERFYVTDKTAYKVDYECWNNRMTCREVPNLADFISFEPAKLLLSVQPPELPALQAHIAALLPDSLTVVQTADFYLEVLPRGVHKGQALSDACEALAIDPARAVAFGDAENDIPMLQRAGLGVAMGNADSRVKAAADRVTLTNDEAGIAALLDEILPDREVDPGKGRECV